VIWLPLSKEKQAVANRFQSPRPFGYFADDYDQDKERAALESAMRQVKQKPER
jgi:hypothetical protein